MKINFTNVKLRANTFGIFFSFIVIAALISLPGCSSGLEQKDDDNTLNFSGDKSFSFKDEGSSWRVDFDDDEISALYKDGARVPDSEIEQYEEMIYEKLNRLKSDSRDLSGNVHHFYFDMDKFGDDMKKFKEDFDDDKFTHFKLEFDDDEFNENMEKLGERLEELKDKKIELYFNSENFKDHLKELEENLKNLPVPPNLHDFDIDIHIDMDDFREEMKSLGESFKNFEFKIDSSDFDLSELRDNMKELKKNMKGLKIDMHDLKWEMKKLNAFLDDLKSELVKDGYLNSTEGDYNLEMSVDKTVVNDVEVKEEDHIKYKKLYKRHFDKEIDGTIKINSD